MSIFINQQIKENTIGYWFGLAIPIVIGWGCSLLSLGILVNTEAHMGGGGPSSIEYFLLVFSVLGHIIVWPLVAWLQLIRAKRLEKIPYENGAKLSLKLYLIWMIYAIGAGLLTLLEAA